MKIIVNNVAAVNSGALSVLKDFISSIKNHKDKGIHWIILLGTLKFENIDNITFISIPWIKKSWFNRLYFELIYGPNLVRKIGGNYVLSLQNMVFPFSKLNQICYFHNALPLSDYRYSIFNNFKFWIYQNLIKHLYILSFIKSKYIIVQSNWMKDEISLNYSIDRNKIFVIPPKIDSPTINNLIIENTVESCFFYPASAVDFKNHKIIIQASKKIKDIYGINLRIVFTLNGNENRLIKSLKEIVISNQLNVSFIGLISRDKVFQYYQNSVLVFPSFIESSPYPLSEAKKFNTIIFSANLKYSKEILNNYNNVHYFNPKNVDELVLLFMKYVNGEIQRSTNKSIIIKENDYSLIDFVVKYTK